MSTLAITLHLLLVAAPSELIINAQPAGVEVKVDGKKSGVSGKPITVKLKAGRHLIRLTYKGDAHEEEVNLKVGEKKTYTWTFEGSAPTTPGEESVP